MRNLNISECYGKQKLRKIRGSDHYEGECGHNCQWREACISASREEGEFRHEQIDILPLKPALADAWLLAEPSGPSELPEQWMPGKDADTKAEAWSYVQDLLHRIAHMYLTAPKQFEAAMRSLFAGETQAQQARLAGVTRQAINAGILMEYAGTTKPQITIPRPLKDERERVVYLLYFVDGCSIRSVAKQINIPPSTVARVVQSVRSKLAQNGTSKRRKKAAKTAKKTKQQNKGV